MLRWSEQQRLAYLGRRVCAGEATAAEAAEFDMLVEYEATLIARSKLAWALGEV